MSTPSQIQAYLVAAQADIEANVSGASVVTVMGQRDQSSIIKEAQEKSSGQAVTLLCAGATPTQQGVNGPRLKHRVQVQVFDHPQLRRAAKRVALDVVEDIMRRLHRSNLQTLSSLCEDCLSDGYYLEQDQGANIYTLEFDVTIHLSTFSP